MTAAIDIKGLEKTYRIGFFGGKTVKALSGLDLTVPEGQVYGLIGPNGAGKSTTIKVLLNLVQASRGDATIYGHRVTDRQARAHVGYVPENPMPYEYLTGREFVTLSGQLHGLGGAELGKRVEEVLGAVGLGAASGLQVRRYSKGMTQRVVLAAALVSKPKLLILDEPTSGLDPVGRRLVRDLILEEKRRGATVLFCTHIISDVETLCDRLALLIGGKKVKEGTVSEMLSGQAPSVEVVVEGLDAARAQAALGAQVERIDTAGQLLLVRCSEASLQAVLKTLLESQGRVTRISPVRFSLEDVFVDAMKASGHGPVGGVIE